MSITLRLFKSFLIYSVLSFFLSGILFLPTYYLYERKRAYEFLKKGKTEDYFILKRDDPSFSPIYGYLKFRFKTKEGIKIVVKRLKVSTFLLITFYLLLYFILLSLLTFRLLKRAFLEVLKLSKIILEGGWDYKHLKNRIRSIKVTYFPELKSSLLHLLENFDELNRMSHLEKLSLKRKAFTDYLTGLYNRFFFEESAKVLFERAKRYNEPLSLIIFDLDDFKRINDEYGHLAGDLVLKEFARIIRGNLRRSDVVARYGGEEFVVLLPNTPKDKAFLVAERIRKKLKERTFELNGNGVTITVSAGVEDNEGKETFEEMLRCADEKLYRAKREGKDRVVV